jgi:hypothetical protein
MDAISIGLLADGRKIGKRRGERDKWVEIGEAASYGPHPYS